jgi:hypothetical protein
MDPFAAHTYDGTENFGRKGIAYDWQSLYAAAATVQIERELAHLTPAIGE